MIRHRFFPRRSYKRVKVTYAHIKMIQRKKIKGVPRKEQTKPSGNSEGERVEDQRRLPGGGGT